MSNSQLIFECVRLPLSSSVHPLVNCCEFAGEPVYNGSSGRFCKVDGCLCSESAYSNMRVFWHCFLRTRKLKQLEKEKV